MSSLVLATVTVREQTNSQNAAMSYRLARLIRVLCYCQLSMAIYTVLSDQQTYELQSTLVECSCVATEIYNNSILR
jgi:hypothetical protein